jgi:hypothetical protein
LIHEVESPRAVVAAYPGSIFPEIAGFDKRVLNKRLGIGGGSALRRLRGMQFKIRTMMIGVVAVALLLMSLRYPALFLAAFVASCTAISYGVWQTARGFKRLPRVAFGVVGISINTVCLIASVAFQSSFLTIILALPCLAGTATAFGLGAAWCTTAARDLGLSWRSRALRWTVAVAVSVAPITILLTQWPFLLAFAASRPALERLADQVSSGVPVSTPQWAGLFRVVASAVDPKTGNVGLVTNPDPGGRSGFERYGARGTPGTSGAFYNFWSEMQLDKKWRYAEED